MPRRPRHGRASSSSSGAAGLPLRGERLPSRSEEVVIAKVAGGVAGLRPSALPRVGLGLHAASPLYTHALFQTEAPLLALAGCSTLLHGPVMPRRSGSHAQRVAGRGSGQIMSLGRCKGGWGRLGLTGGAMSPRRLADEHHNINLISGR